MYLTNKHNRDVHTDRVNNKGVLKAQFESADELEDTGVDIRPSIYDEVDELEYPSALNFLPPEIFREVINQKPPSLSEISVAFPLHTDWQYLKELATEDANKMFMAKPPRSLLSTSQLTTMQKWAVELGLDKEHNVFYYCGKVGSGKPSARLKYVNK